MIDSFYLTHERYLWYIKPLQHLSSSIFQQSTQKINTSSYIIYYSDRSPLPPCTYSVISPEDPRIQKNLSIYGKPRNPVVPVGPTETFIGNVLLFEQQIPLQKIQARRNMVRRGEKERGEMWWDLDSSTGLLWLTENAPATRGKPSMWMLNTMNQRERSLMTRISRAATAMSRVVARTRSR